MVALGCLSAERSGSGTVMDNPWTIWAARNGIPVPSEDDPPDCEIESDSMLLNREDADLFGLCPAWDEFYLVRCDECHKVLKPMALKHHIELRHSRSSRSPSTTSSEMSIEASNSKTFSFKYHSSSSSSTASSTSSSRNKSSSVKVKLTKAAAKELNREREISLTRSQNSQDNSAYGCQSSAAKEDSEQSSSSSNSSTNCSPAAVNSAKTTLEIASSIVNSCSRSPITSEERTLATPVVVLTKALLVNTNSSTDALIIPQRTTSGDSLKRPLLAVPDSALPSGKKKFLPCKDREYDPNKHCGVIASDTGKPCTRSLTCKTHSLSLRRGVPGRLKGFDDLLAENRAAKEQKPPLCITTTGDSVPQLSPRSVHPSQLVLPPSPSVITVMDGQGHSSPTIGEGAVHQLSFNSPSSLAPALIQQQQQQHSSPPSSRSVSPSPQVLLATPDGKLTLPVIRLSGSPPPPPPQLIRHDPGPPLAQQLAQSGVGGLGAAAIAVGSVGPMNSLVAGMLRNGSAAGGGLLSSLRSAALPARPIAVPVENPAHNPSAGVQPRPAAMCTFGMRVLSSSNVVLLDRRWDATRGALAAALSPQILPSGPTSLLINRQGMNSGTTVGSGSTSGPGSRRRIRTTPIRPSSPKQQQQLARKLLSSVRVGVSGLSSLSMVSPPGQLAPAQLTAGQ